MGLCEGLKDADRRKAYGVPVCLQVEGIVQHNVFHKPQALVLLNIAGLAPGVWVLQQHGASACYWRQLKQQQR